MFKVLRDVQNSSTDPMLNRVMLVAYPRLTTAIGRAVDTSKRKGCKVYVTGPVVDSDGVVSPDEPLLTFSDGQVSS